MKTTGATLSNTLARAELRTQAAARLDKSSQKASTFWQKMFAAWIRPYEKGDVFML